MRILVLGGTGMLGHQLVKSLSPRHEVYDAPRQSFDAQEMDSAVCLRALFGWFKPEVVLNAIGIVKQRPTHSESEIEMIAVNALFPHKLAALTRAFGARLIHFSTDCVFNGAEGEYTEYDIPAPGDLYGRSKLLGEVEGYDCLTLRTSIIGRELGTKRGLVEWFLEQQHNYVHGFANVTFSGLTTIELARVVERVLHTNATGVWHVGGDRISKYALLCMLKAHYNLSTRIAMETKTACDRSLDSTRFRHEFSYTPPSWNAMIAELAGSFDDVTARMHG